MSCQYGHMKWRHLLSVRPHEMELCINCSSIVSNSSQIVFIVKTFLRSFFFSLTLVIDSANLFNRQPSSTETRVFHETGCVPPPLNHSCRTFVLMSFAFFQYLFSQELILDLLVLSRRSAPTSKYFAPISWAMFSLAVPSA